MVVKLTLGGGSIGLEFNCAYVLSLVEPYNLTMAMSGWGGPVVLEMLKFGCTIVFSTISVSPQENVVLSTLSESSSKLKSNFPNWTV